MLTLDHLFPRRSRFRDNHATRVVTSCLICNTSRKQTNVATFLKKIRLSGFDVAAVVARLARRHWPLVYDIDPRLIDPRKAGELPSDDLWNGWVDGWLGPVLFVLGVPY